MVTQVISTVNDPYSDQVVIDKGSVNGVYEGQPVISDKGVVGQVVAVAKMTSRVLLICDATHALPIRVLRNDIRVIAAGNGCTDDLQRASAGEYRYSRRRRAGDLRSRRSFP